MSEHIYGSVALYDIPEFRLEKREEIVRCRDCKCFATNIHGSYCKKSITWLSEPNGFCAWGVRRES